MGKNWIAGAIKHPGALHAQAQAANAVRKDGTIDRDWLVAEAKRPGKTGARARLALKMRGFEHKGK